MPRVRTVGGPRRVFVHLSDTGKRVTSYKLGGTVLDASSVPVAGILVRLFETGTDQKVLDALTDASGVYTLDVTGGKSFWLAVDRAGSPETVGITVNSLTGG